MPPPVRYARSGDLSIAYQVIGRGPPDLIWCIGSYSHLDLLWEDPSFARTFEHLGETTRLLVLDKRGMGLSDQIDMLSTPSRSGLTTFARSWTRRRAAGRT